MAKLLIVCIFFVLVLGLMMLPAWLLLLAVNYLLAVTHVAFHVPITFVSVLCVAFVLNILRGIFSRKG